MGCHSRGGHGVGSSPLTRGKRCGCGRAVLQPRLIPAHAGKTCSRANSASAFAGSSPLTRGKLCPSNLAGHECRLIPAHAGKTSRSPSRRPLGEAHPRSRGENHGLCTGKSTRLGSSPLTRGKLKIISDIRAMRGLIPAHAGKTSTARSRVRRRAAHPRSRGENKAADELVFTARGSSPLTRGKRQALFSTRPPRGLIPAHAGKTPRARLVVGRLRAHPRSRGENMAITAAKKLSDGSSPLTRGKRPHGHDLQPRRRLIPAHAGKTRPVICSHRVIAAHPRSRGENQAVWSCRLPDGRLIPAHAGKTAAVGICTPFQRAHPRSRGENAVHRGLRDSKRGSSPLTRGKHVAGV